MTAARPRQRPGRDRGSLTLMLAVLMVVLLALVGLVPLSAGAAGVCLAAPLLKAPLRAR